MKTKIKYLLLAVFMTVFCLAALQFSVFAADDVVADLDDAALYQGILDQLSENGIAAAGKNDNNYTITLKQSDVSRITALKLENLRIKKIDGLEKFTNLEDLDLSNNHIEDLTPISNLTALTSLELDGNNLSDVSDLTGLTNLKSLNLSNNKLADDAVISDISKIRELRSLDLSHNLLKTTNGISALSKLGSLDLYDNFVDDASGLNGLKDLKKLDLGMNQPGMTGLDKIAALTSLTEFRFDDNRTPEIINFVGGLTNLEKLALASNYVRDVTNLAGLPNLKTLILHNNKISNAEPILGLSKLETLDLSTNEITKTADFVRGGSVIYPNMKEFSLYANWGAGWTSADKAALLVLNNSGFKFYFQYNDYKDGSSHTHFDAQGKGYTTFEDFGAMAVEGYDDTVAFRNAFRYCQIAADCDYILGGAGKNYHLYNYYGGNIDIYDSVDFNGAALTIHDENIDHYKDRYEPLFQYRNMYDRMLTIDDPEITVNKTTTSAPGLLPYLSELSAQGYTRYLVKFYNANKKQYIRYGENANGGNDQRDMVIMDADGNFENDVQWDFDDITSVDIWPMPTERQFIKNATLIYKNPTSDLNDNYERIHHGKYGYWYRNFRITNSGALDISNMNFTLEHDEIAPSMFGYILLDDDGDITISDTKMFSRQYNMSRSGYGLKLEDTVGLTISNFDSLPHLDGTDKRWGIMGSAYLKDFKINDSFISRIDAHEGAYNMTVKNTTVGTLGLTLIGQGTFSMTDSTIIAYTMMSLRGDFGSTWNGDIVMKNITFKPYQHWQPRIVEYGVSYDGDKVHDFGYQLKMPNISITDLTIDYEYLEDPVKQTGNLLLLSNWPDIVKPGTEEQLTSYWPDNILINRYSFKNSLRDADYIKTSVNEFEPFSKVNMLVEDLKITDGGTDITDANGYQTKDPIKISFVKHPNIANSYRLTRNGEVMFEKTAVDADFDTTLSEPGQYVLTLYMDKSEANYTGSREYSFTILAEDEPVKPSDPDQPSEPERPGTPVQPEAPTKPASPVEPEEPAQPTDSEKSKALDGASSNEISTSEETKSDEAGAPNTGTAVRQSENAEVSAFGGSILVAIILLFLKFRRKSHHYIVK